LPIAATLIDAMGKLVGRSRRDIDTSLDALSVPARDRAVVLGLRKLLDDRCDFEVVSPLDPTALRREVFAAAAAAYHALGVRDELDRDAVLTEVAGRIGATREGVEQALYADLRDSEVLRHFRPISAPALLDRYDVALAQGIVLRATQVTVRIENETPDRYRRIFRAARFHGLLHVVQGNPKDGYTITLDGPYSLFDAGVKYGLKLALFLPVLLPCRTWSLRADVLWGKSRRPAVFELGPADRLAAIAPETPTASPDLEAFCASFSRLGTRWTVLPNERLFALPGEVACIPDLVFSSNETGEEVFLEAFGFWSREAVFRRIELVRKGFPARIILAVSKKLRVSEELLTEEDGGELYVYGASMSPRAVLERLEGAPRRPHRATAE
jgi:predicted nuclease of restriction endonuclease-like RecB superfamily